MPVNDPIYIRIMSRSIQCHELHGDVEASACRHRLVPGEALSSEGTSGALAAAALELVISAFAAGNTINELDEGKTYKKPGWVLWHTPPLLQMPDSH